MSFDSPRFHRARHARLGIGLRTLVLAQPLLLAQLLLSQPILLASTDARAASAEEQDGSEGGCREAGLAQRMALKIQQRYETIRDLRARFEQTNESATFGGTPLMTAEAKRGRVVFAKPGRMRWSYEQPDRSEVVSDGETLWIYDVEAESATRLEVTAGFLSGAALQFLLGDGKILESFEVEATACAKDRVTLDLIPRQDSSYERLGLVADRESGDVLATSVLDLFGNLTRIRFEAVEINRDPGPEIFELEVPEGVEVIEYDAPPAR
ncbi:MAG: LolA family protein [bacterium]